MLHLQRKSAYLYYGFSVFNFGSTTTVRILTKTKILGLGYFVMGRSQGFMHKMKQNKPPHLVTQKQVDYNRQNRHDELADWAADSGLNFHRTLHAGKIGPAPYELIEESRNLFESRVFIGNWWWVSQGSGRFFKFKMVNRGNSLRLNTYWSALSVAALAHSGGPRGSSHPRFSG